MNDFRETPSSNGRRNLTKLPQAGEQLQILFHILAETDARIKNNLLRQDTGGFQFLQSFRKKTADFTDDVHLPRRFFCEGRAARASPRNLREIRQQFSTFRCRCDWQRHH